MAPQHYDTDLAEARTSLTYWEERQRNLPKRDVRGRREAAARADKARARVTELEQSTFGAGLAGTLAQLASEGRVPEPVRQTGKQIARRSRQALIIAAALTVTALIVTLVLIVLLLTAIF